MDTSVPSNAAREPASERGSKPVTGLLAAVGRGVPGAQEQLWTALYEELRRMAHGQMTREGPSRSLQTTALVHEAYVRLLGPDGDGPQFNDRRHFFAAAAQAMRRICIDDARKRKRLKRGGNHKPVPLHEASVPNPQRVRGTRAAGMGSPGWFDGDPGELLAIDDALEKLEALDARRAEVVKLRYFAGLTGDETAGVLGVSPRTVDSEWRLARAWLHRELSA